MARCIASFLFCALAYSCIGQPSHFFADGARWVYHISESSEPGQEFNHLSDEQNIIHGDTTIYDKRYLKLYTTRHNTLVVNIFPPVMVDSYDSIGPTYLRYDTLEHSVYYLPDIDSTEKLIYDFNLEVGDTTPMQSNSYPSVVSSIDTVTIFGVALKRFFVGEANPSWPDTRNVIIEGIGGSNGLTYYQPVWDVVSGGFYSTSFICFHHGDSIYSYIGDTCPFIDFISSTKTVPHDIKLTVSPNPANKNFSIDISEDLLDATFTIVDYLGRIVKSFKLTELNTMAQLDVTGLFFWNVVQDGQLINNGKLIVNE